jgi:hypothetical protein
MTTTTPTLPYAMSSDDSEDKQTNTKNKWGRGGYSSEIFIKNAGRIVRENRLLCVKMRETIELARRRGYKPWKINSTSWRRAIKS